MKVILLTLSPTLCSSGRIRTYNQRLTRIPQLPVARTISSPLPTKGARRFPWLAPRVLPCGIVSTPAFVQVTKDWLGIAPPMAGFPRIHLVFDLNYSRKLQYFTGRCSTIELPRSRILVTTKNSYKLYSFSKKRKEISHSTSCPLLFLDFI